MKKEKIENYLAHEDPLCEERTERNSNITFLRPYNVLSKVLLNTGSGRRGCGSDHARTLSAPTLRISSAGDCGVAQARKTGERYLG